MSFKNRQVIGLIPARGGSKGVRRKNMRTLLGRPLLEYTIQAAFDSAFIDHIYVSSEDQEILEAAEKMKALTTTRSLVAATDSATASDVVNDFLKKIPSDLKNSDPYLVFLQPTSPLRTGAHIDAAFREMSAADSDVCVSVTALKKIPFKSFILTQEGRLKSLFDESLTNANRQSLPVVYYPNGAIYVFPISKFIARNGFPSNGGVPYIMSEQESVDIDTEEDFAMVEKKWRAN